MGVAICIESVKTVCRNPYRRVVDELIDLWAGYDSHIWKWFEQYRGDPIDMGPYYEFGTETMDEFLKDYQNALEGKGWFVEQDDFDKDDIDRYKEIVDVLTDFKNKNADHWDDGSIYFFFSVG